MDPIKPATEANAQAIAPAAASTVTDDLEAKFTALEAEKENYRQAYLKADAKNKAGTATEDVDEEERMTRIAQKALSESRLVEIAREQDAIIRQTLKENKELKLAKRNTSQPAAAVGASTEAPATVHDTLVTPDQMAAFKARGWTDKDIERYKTNLRKKV